MAWKSLNERIFPCLIRGESSNTFTHNKLKLKENKMKNLVTAAALTFTLAGAAQAQDMFAFMGNQDEGTSVIIIEPLSATADGFVAIYDYRTGVAGDLLGVASVREGANNQTRVQIGRGVRDDVIAYLFAGNDFTDPSKALDSVKIDIED
jgi:hypothetical protein